MKLCWAAAVAVALSCGSASAQELTPNSNFFSVTDYWYIDPDGDFRPYRVAGFAQPADLGVPQRLYLLPTVFVKQDDVQFFDVTGQKMPPAAYSIKQAGSITIAPRIVNTLPNETQRPAIAAALKGVSEPSWLPPPAMTGFGNPPIHPMASGSPLWIQSIHASYSDYVKKRNAQTALADEYKGYTPTLAVLSELKISLMIDGEEATSRKMAGASVSTASILPAVTLSSPTEVQQNKIKEGNFEIQVSYRFLDTKVSAINAKLDAQKIMNDFLSETQQAITKSKSSSFQVFHIGSRKSKISTSISRQVDSKFSGDNIKSTKIIMYDATDDMIKEFETTFFPQVVKDDVIKGHLDAAVAAATAGQQDLAKIHTDYAVALQSSNQLAEVDAVGAAAALNNKDYAGFVAKGVRASNTNDVQANNFIRIVNEQSVISSNEEWNQVRQVSVQRETSLSVAPSDGVEQSGRFGLCGIEPTNWQAIMPAPYGPPTIATVSGLLVTCVQQASPTLAANILPGEMITAVNGQSVTSIGDFEQVVSTLSPGDVVNLRMLRPTVTHPTKTSIVQVKLKRGGPANYAGLP